MDDEYQKVLDLREQLKLLYNSRDIVDYNANIALSLLTKKYTKSIKKIDTLENDEN